MALYDSTIVFPSRMGLEPRGYDSYDKLCVQYFKVENAQVRPMNTLRSVENQLKAMFPDSDVTDVLDSAFSHGRFLTMDCTIVDSNPTRVAMPLSVEFKFKHSTYVASFKSIDELKAMTISYAENGTTYQIKRVVHYGAADEAEVQSVLEQVAQYGVCL